MSSFRLLAVSVVFACITIFGSTDILAFPKEGNKLFAEESNATLGELHFILPADLSSNNAFSYPTVKTETKGGFDMEAVVFKDEGRAEGLIMLVSTTKALPSHLTEPERALHFSRLKRYYPNDVGRIGADKETLPHGPGYSTTHYSTHNIEDGETCTHIFVNAGHNSVTPTQEKRLMFFELSYCENGRSPNTYRTAMDWITQVQIKN